jgi:hypothetical protein
MRYDTGIISGYVFMGRQLALAPLLGPAHPCVGKSTHFAQRFKRLTYSSAEF